MIVVNVRTLASTPTGVQRYVSQLLPRLGDEVQAIAPGRKLGGVGGHLWEQLVLPIRVAKRLLWSPAMTGPLAVRRQVVTVHDLAVLEHPEWFSRKFAGWYRWLLPKLAHRAARVIAVSQFTGARLVEITRVDPDKVTVVPNGVDGRFTPASEDEITQVRESLGIAAGRYVLYVGTLEPRKNLSRLIEAWDMARRDLPPDVCMVIAGNKGRRPVFAQVSLDQLPPRVLLTGRVADEQLPGLYSGATVFVYPSMYEGFGLPALEAMACGTPVITSDRTALPEVVDDAAVTVDPSDAGAIADAVRQMVTDDALRERLSRRGLQRASKFTWDRAAEMTLQVLRKAR